VVEESTDDITDIIEDSGASTLATGFAASAIFATMMA
jgi:hypothetical protein